MKKTSPKLLIFNYFLIFLNAFFDAIYYFLFGFTTGSIVILFQRKSVIEASGLLVNSAEFQTFITYLVLLLLSLILSILLSYFTKRIWSRNINSWRARLRKMVTKNLLRTSSYKINNEFAKSQQNLYLNQADDIYDDRYQEIYRLVYVIGIMLTSLSVIFTLNWVLGFILIAIIIVPLVLQGVVSIPVNLIAKNIEPYTNEFVKTSRTVHEGYISFVANNKQNFASVLLRNYSQLFKKRIIKININIFIPLSIVQIISIANQVVMIFLTAFFLFNPQILGSLTAPITIATFLVLASQGAYFNTHFIGLLQAIGAIVTTKSRMKAYNLIAQEDKNKEESFSFHTLSFENVSFANDNKEEVIKNLSFEIERGKKHLIQGASGVGKSVLIKLMLKMLEPSAGLISVNKSKLEEINTTSWYKKVHYVPKEGLLIDGSLQENYLLNEEMLKSTIATPDALKAATFDFKRVAKVTKNFRVNEFSSGEKQKMALARFFKNPKEILILDEAFANIDKESKKALMAKFVNNKSLTLINISHDPLLQSEVYYDQIITL